MSETFTHIAVLAGRSVRISRRAVDALVMALLLPLMLLLVFVYFFGGAIDTGRDTEYVTYVVPGILVLCAAFGAGTTAVSVSDDMQGGTVDRFRALDVSGTALLAGHVAASTLRNLVSTGLVLAFALLIGFRPDASAAGWLAAGALLGAFLVAISWFSAAMGLLARSPEAAGGFTFLLTFLPYPSSAFVPVDTMPGWLHPFADHQPVTPLIESLRGLLLGLPVGNAPWIALLWCGGLLAVSVAASGVLFRLRVD
ncbi:ABC transporter permease [Streptomyces clavuligerus]|uniref:Transport permease protein n=1 Tax=Streptomyces clavuligerus TaxID=1901 RepID=D5SK74_STRCL|nr:ABC transporter permease [Streptomyces clavuligerus]ANW22249.1 multidrug ABC transporter permease [Streptomyces clavuligerus]AXU17144.1 ABC transporter permease [Streptomyces clavuligerus]EFG04317.1 ABC-type multidrug transporter [Streptomyces clavuligerus]MBY6307209.1 ABC transporter permease [Streptomyces clavuligerus]QCS10212.1 ABC transporter permease [Streptomyces clavuligerus]